MKTAGSQTLTATDTVSSSIAGTSGAINVTTTTVTVAGITASDKVYDATTAAILNNLGGATLVGILSGDNVTLDISAAAGTFADKNVGTDKIVSVSGLTLSGPDAYKYTITQPTTTASITAKTLTVSATGVNMVYDGTMAATVTLSDDRLAGDNLTDSYATATFTDANVGTGKAVSVSGISISGPDVGNYMLSNTTANTTADITALAITVTAATNSKIYDGTTTAAALPTITSGSLVSGDTASFTESYDTKNVGTSKTLTAAGLVNDGNGGNNYAVTFVADTTGVITARSLTVTATTNSKVYDGTTSAAALPRITRGGLAAGDTANFTETYDTKDVGTSKTLTAAGVVNDGNGGNNYVVTFVADTTGEDPGPIAHGFGHGREQDLRRHLGGHCQSIGRRGCRR